jgi:NADH-quinone oxidoreductase subunit N
MKPVLILSGLGLLALFAEMFRFRRALYPLLLIGVAGAVASAVSYIGFDDGEMGEYIKTMISFDAFAIVASTIMLVTLLLWFVLARDFFSDENNVADHSALVLFAVVGAILLTCYKNMTMLFLGIEILSIPLYVLAGSKKTSLSSNESAFKYFLMGSFASGFLLFGITLIYGATGSFDLGEIGAAVSSKAVLPGYFFAGIVMLLVGLLFKVSIAPFHFWAPDVYDGAPTPVTALMSTVVKTAAFAAIVRLYVSPVFSGVADFWLPILGVCTALTLVIGNVTAVVQTSVKRMLAYSSVAHAGFLLMAVASGSVMAIVNPFAVKGVLFYAAAYSAASIAAFTVLLIVGGKSGDVSIDRFNGLGKKNPLVAVVMTIALLSLAGIPPTSGFFGKYYILTAAFQGGHAWLAIIGILGSLVGVYYYFRVIIAMFFREANEETVTATSEHQGLLFVTAVIIIVLGLLPDLLFNFCDMAMVAMQPVQ